MVSIALFDKPAGQWCSYAKPGKGCGIHRSRPFVCQSAFCEWMIAKGLGDEWKPERARFAIFVRNDAERRAAEESRMRLMESGVLKKPVVTEILPAAPFYAAEEYHQYYYKKNPLRYRWYRSGCGRDKRLQEVWGKQTKAN